MVDASAAQEQAPGPQAPAAAAAAAAAGPSITQGAKAGSVSGLGRAMVATVSWMDDNRSALVASSLTAIAGSLALLLYLEGLPGWRRHISITALPSSFLRGLAGRLPVLIDDFKVEGGQLTAQLVHYPLLLRWWHRYRGVPPHAFAHSAAAAGHALQVHLAGVRDPAPAAVLQLLGLPRGEVHRLRVLELGLAPEHLGGDAAVQQAQQPAASLLPPAAAALLQPPAQQHSSAVQVGAAGGAACPPAASSTEASCYRAVPAGDDPASNPASTALVSTASPASNSSYSCGHGQLQPMLWGELYVRGRPGSSGSGRGAGGRGGGGWQLPLLRRNLSEQLLAEGLAWPAYLEDMHLAGCSNRQLDRYMQAAMRAAARSKGVWARQPLQQQSWAAWTAQNLRRLLPGGPARARPAELALAGMDVRRPQLLQHSKPAAGMLDGGCAGSSNASSADADAPSAGGAASPPWRRLLARLKVGSKSAASSAGKATQGTEEEPAAVVKAGDSDSAVSLSDSKAAAAPAPPMSSCHEPQEQHDASSSSYANVGSSRVEQSDSYSSSAKVVAFRAARWVSWLSCRSRVSYLLRLWQERFKSR